MTDAAQPGAAPRLSICIATRNRAKFIGETLESIVGQMQAGVEIVIVDGASTDATPEIVAGYARRYDSLRYYREATNSGVDADYDKALGYARGEFCWLMPDDDLMARGAIQRVLAAIERGPDLIVVDAEVRTVDFSRSLGRRLAQLPKQSEYSAADADRLFRDTAPHLTFIGAAIVRRAWWMERDRISYYGSLFIHVGVIFQQPPPAKAIVIAEPLITIRYGNAMWTPRYSEIWLFKWPDLVWSFDGYPAATRAAVAANRPWRRFRTLLLHRAVGGYSIEAYRRLLADKVGWREKWVALAVARMPGSIANALVAAFIALVRPHARIEMHDVLASPHASRVTRWFAKRVGL